jgi:RNA polymerase sigma-70 factor (ECF subfamily)
MEHVLMRQSFPLERQSEQSLLSACRRQDVAAFETLYCQHGARMKSVAYHVLRNRQDAEDAVQEAFVKAYRSILEFRGDCSAASWLCRIVVNVCYDHLRKRSREPVLAIEPEASVPSANLRMALEEALSLIHPKHRMVFLLYESEGLRHAEIATVLDIPEGTSKAWLFEAKQHLKRILEHRP